MARDGAPSTWASFSSRVLVVYQEEEVAAEGAPSPPSRALAEGALAEGALVEEAVVVSMIHLVAPSACFRVKK